MKDKRNHGFKDRRSLRRSYFIEIPRKLCYTDKKPDESLEEKT